MEVVVDQEEEAAAQPTQQQQQQLHDSSVNNKMFVPVSWASSYGKDGLDAPPAPPDAWP